MNSYPAAVSITVRAARFQAVENLTHFYKSVLYSILR